MVSVINNIKDIKWDSTNIPFNSDISVLRHIPFNLPHKFLELLKISDGGNVNYDFDYYDIDYKKIIGTGLPCIYGILEGENDNLLHKYNNHPEFFPKNLIPFSSTGNGDLICFDYRSDSKSDNPPIVYWNHEADEGKDVSFVAKDFEEFLSILREPEE